ncbi:MAG: hypothetical protein ACI9DJ_003339, partial [Algoriphagus sp.]
AQNDSPSNVFSNLQSLFEVSEKKAPSIGISVDLSIK